MNLETSSRMEAKPNIPETQTKSVAGTPECCLIDRVASELRNEVAQALCQLQVLAERCNRPMHSQLLGDSIRAVNGPFRFVILGEVKSGKSSFVNALVGADICKVAPEPCTDVIQELIYAETEEVQILGPRQKRIGRPIELLKRISLVDTPGTNSLANNHEVISREYVPHSDLVIFVFPAKNPHTESAWNLLRFIRQEWSRKVIFVLQQMDLEPEHLQRQMQCVRQYATGAGISEPVVFATSAEWKLKGLTDRSGVGAVRQHIRQSVTGGRYILHKLESHLSTASKVLTDLRAELSAAASKLEQDRTLRNKVQTRLGRGKDRSTKEVEALAGRLSEAYDDITSDFKAQFKDGMDTWSVIWRSLPGTTSHKEWLGILRGRFETALEKKITRMAFDEASRFMEAIRSLILELLEETKKEASPSQTAGTLDRLDLERQEMLKAIEAQLEDLVKDQESLHKGLSEAARNVGQSIMGGSLLASLGILIATATKLIIFDITGGILATLGVLLAGFALVWKRGKIIEEFGRALDRAKAQFTRDLRDKLSADLRGIYGIIDQKFAGLDVLLESQQNDLQPKLQLAEDVEVRLTALKNKVAGLLEIA